MYEETLQAAVTREDAPGRAKILHVEIFHPHVSGIEERMARLARHRIVERAGDVCHVAVLDHVDVTGGRPDPHPLGDTVGGNLIHWLSF